MMKFSIRDAVALILAVVVAARQQQVAAFEMKDLARGFINRYTSSNGFDQLNTLVTSPFTGDPRSAEAVFKQIEEFLAKPESKKAKSKELSEAAEQFVQLNRKHGEQACDLDNLRSMFKLHESLNSGLPQSFSLIGPNYAHRRQLLKIFRQLGRENARSCLDEYQSRWAELIARPDWFGGHEEERRISKHLLILQEETNELSCQHKFESVRPTVRYFECTLLAADAPLNQPDDAHDLKLALERIQITRDDSQKALTRFDADSNTFKPKSDDEIKTLVVEYLHEPCEKLMANEAGTRLLKGVELFATMFGLPDELFLRYNAITDHLVKWTGRLVLCERLLKRTNTEELAQALSHNARF